MENFSFCAVSVVTRLQIMFHASAEIILASFNYNKKIMICWTYPVGKYLFQVNLPSSDIKTYCAQIFA